MVSLDTALEISYILAVYSLVLRAFLQKFIKFESHSHFGSRFWGKWQFLSPYKKTLPLVINKSATSRVTTNRSLLLPKIYEFYCLNVSLKNVLFFFIGEFFYHECYIISPQVSNDFFTLTLQPDAYNVCWVHQWLMQQWRNSILLEKISQGN